MKTMPLGLIVPWAPAEASTMFVLTVNLAVIVCEVCMAGNVCLFCPFMVTGEPSMSTWITSYPVFGVMVKLGVSP